MYMQHHSLADRRRNAVGSYTKISPHFRSGHLGESQHLPFHLLLPFTTGTATGSTRENWSAVLPLPQNLRFRIAPGLAHQFRRPTFRHHHVAGRFLVHYVRRDHHLQEGGLRVQRRNDLMNRLTFLNGLRNLTEQLQYAGPASIIIKLNCFAPSVAKRIEINALSFSN